MKRVLITGASGFIGQHCLPYLLESGYEVHAVSSRGRDRSSPEIQWHRVDLLDSVQVRTLMAKVRPTHLLHFAWVTEPKTYLTSLENVQWVQASLDLLFAWAKHGGKRVVMAGTCAEYDWRYGYCSEETTPRMPSSLYGVCKHALQSLLDAYVRQLGLDAAWGRVFFLYGPHEHPDRLLSSVTRSLLRGKPANCSHGNQIRDFLYVEDVARAFVALLESKVSGSVNIASGCPIALKDIIHIIAEKLNQRDLVRLGALPTSAQEPHLLVADISRLTHQVGWLPKFDLDKGLERTIGWWRRHITEKEHDPR